MKRILAIVFAVFILSALLIMPVAASAANSAATSAVIAANSNKRTFLASLKVQCQLGEITLYLPYGIGKSALRYEEDYLRNMTESTLYLYCPEFPDYVFSASRFSPVTYREPNATNYQTVQLIVSNASVLSVDARSAFGVLLIAILSVSMCSTLWGSVRRV